MFLSFLVPILSGILGASTATAVVGTVSSAVTAVATASAGEVLAVAGTTVATVGLVGVAKGMNENKKRNKCETRRIYKEINEKKGIVDKNFSEEKSRIKSEKKEAESDFKENYRKKSIEEFDKLVSSRIDAKRKFARIRKG